MRLLDPTPGEMIDRLTILDLKIYNSNTQKQIEWFCEEQRLLLDKLSTYATSNRDLAPYRDKLFTINKELWYLIDEVRELPDIDNNVLRLAYLAKKIPRLNDERAETVEQINKFYGINTTEKIYNEKRAVSKS